MTFKFIFPALTLPLTLDPNAQLPACHLHLTCQNRATHISSKTDHPTVFLISMNVSSTLWVTQGYWLYLQNIPRIQSLFTTPSLITLVQHHLISCLDFCKSLLSGINVSAPATLWSILPAVARVILFKSGHTHSFAQNSLMACISLQGRA